jgi:hypothetical protein
MAYVHEGLASLGVDLHEVGDVLALVLQKIVSSTLKHSLTDFGFGVGEGFGGKQ